MLNNAGNSNIKRKSTFQNSLIQLMMWEEVATAAKVMIGRLQHINDVQSFMSTRRKTCPHDLFDPGGQEGTGVDWQRCGGEGSEEWNRSEDILAQAA